MAWGLFPVYCETAKECCCDDDIYLGMYPLKVAVRCPICGRYSRARKGVQDDQSRGWELYRHKLRQV